MTDYTDLVNWLRDNAIGVVSFRPKFIEAANAIEEQADRIAALEAALKPFADYSQVVDWEVFTPEMHFARSLKFSCDITYGDLRAARAAMEGKDD